MGPKQMHVPVEEEFDAAAAKESNPMAFRVGQGDPVQAKDRWEHVVPVLLSVDPVLHRATLAPACRARKPSKPFPFPSPPFA